MDIINICGLKHIPGSKREAFKKWRGWLIMDVVMALISTILLVVFTWLLITTEASSFSWSSLVFYFVLGGWLLSLVCIKPYRLFWYHIQKVKKGDLGCNICGLYNAAKEIGLTNEVKRWEDYRDNIVSINKGKNN